MRTLILLFLLSMQSICSAYAADEFPTNGLLYNTKETSSLVYSCEKMSDGFLECEFTQTSVRKKLKAKDLDKKLKEAEEQFPGALKDLTSDKECESMQNMLGAFEDGRTLEEIAETSDFISDKEQFIKSMGEMPAAQKKDMKSTLQAINEFCETKSKESYLKFIRLGLDKEMSTCLIGPNTYKQKFRFVEDYASGIGAWVVDGNPEGPCGIVQLSRFEPEKTELGDSTITFWKYIAKKAITNPKGTLMGLGSCSELDEDEYMYDWRSKEHHMNCDYIEFSPF